MGFCGDFKFERKGKKILIRDKFTLEKIGGIELDERNLKLKKRG